jgi:hypothetical protein
VWLPRLSLVFPSFSMAAKHQRQIHEVSNKDSNGDRAIRWIRTYCDAGGLRISTDLPHVHPSIRFGLCVVGDVDGLHGPLARPPLSLMRNTISRAWDFHKLLSEVQNSELNKKEKRKGDRRVFFCLSPFSRSSPPTISAPRVSGSCRRAASE